ncbi:MAG: class I SAM-dependent methyltransferase [Planctomycetes bacterium]|nr:class I SAM-dependent methyltransferase [Planctomycetota bacterium]
MLPRVLEPEVMDSAAEARDYDAMDHSEVNRVFVADFLTYWKGNGPILDVGTGTAQIPIELCRQHPAAQVTGVDLAEHMLAVGRANVHKAGLERSITLQKVDAKTLPFPEGNFAAIISNSIVHHIPKPESALAEMLRVVKSGGVVFVRDLLRPDSDEAVRILVQKHAGNDNDHQRKMFDDSLRAALTLSEIRALVEDMGFDRADVRQTSDRHWTWAARLPRAA